MFVLLGLLLTSPAQAVVPMTFGDIEIIPGPAPRGNSSHGYFEYVFHIVNKSDERPHTVSLSIPFETYFTHGDTIRELRRSVQVGAQETAQVSLLQPDYPPLSGADVAVTIDGRRQEHELPLKPNESMRRSFSGRYFTLPGMVEALVLMGHGVKPMPTVESAMPRKIEGPPGGIPARFFVPPAIPPPEKPGLPERGFQFVTAETWSNNWLAYTRYDGIVISAAELNALPAGTRTALWQYVETGGALLVLGHTDLHGLCAVSETKKDKAGWISVQAGFGICRISPDANYEAWDSSRFNLLMKDWNNTVSVWSGRSVDPNQEFPVIDDLGIPIRGLFVLMFLFTLGIGPINILVLSRLKRRIWLLWTTPALSLCTCLAVLGYMLISEGWRGRLRSETLTLLDETTHRATTIGWTGFYSPLTPGDGLHFGYETEVLPQWIFEGRRGGGRSCTIDWSQDQHFAAGWVEARVPAHFKVRKSELRRERVSLYRERDGRWSMVNGLGAGVRRFWYADAKGQIHTAEDVAPGARAMLTRTEKECQISAKTMQNILSGNWRLGMEQIALNPPHYLRPGLYLAEVDDSLFLEDALRNTRTRKLHALIVGFGNSGPRASVRGGEKR